MSPITSGRNLAAAVAAAVFTAGPAAAAAGDPRTVVSLDQAWKFELVPLNDTGRANCTDATFEVDLTGTQCSGLSQQLQVASADACQATCCGSSACNVWQWCPEDASGCSPAASCWTASSYVNLSLVCYASDPDWESSGTNVQPAPAPAPNPGDACAQDECQAGFNDSSWRVVSVPHDFVVEGTFDESADMSHGYLPYASGWYRREFTLPEGFADGNKAVFLEFDGAMTSTEVWLNGEYLGGHASGYTPFSFEIAVDGPATFGEDAPNVLAVFVDSTEPDGWWYDGGGLYRHVRWVATNPVHLAQWGVYHAAQVVGDVDTANNVAPEAWLFVQAEVRNDGTAAAGAQVAVTFRATAPDGSTWLDHTETGAAPAVNGTTTVQANVSFGGAPLWSPETPQNVFAVTTTVALDGEQVDSIDTTFGVRKTAWDADLGFFLNDAPRKILGTANHQDFAGVGVAVPDSLQPFRVQRLQAFGANAWRTAHNAPTEALLETTDRLGMLVWDENHRNGEPNEMEILIKRDRNHPSIVLWSLCNEVLCESDDQDNDAEALIDVIHEFDPYGGRAISANNNGFNGPDTFLDVQGYDYATSSYDDWHALAPNVPSISSETSSAVSDRGEYANDNVTCHVTGYDTEAPSWGQTAQVAWSAILTDDFIAGGFTWTGFDYKGEPTPYYWPNINSHFGILDIAGFAKDRTAWYHAWFKPDEPLAYVFPHWNWQDASSGPAAHLSTCRGLCRLSDDGTAQVDVWAFGNLAEYELLVNNQSQGRLDMPQYGHVNWTAVPYQPGEVRLLGFQQAGDVDPLLEDVVTTTGAAAAVRVSTTFVANSSLVPALPDGPQVALVKAEVVDGSGAVVPTAADTVNFAAQAGCTVVGGGNGDPSEHTADHATARPAYHGNVMAVIQKDDGATTCEVSATATGLDGGTVTFDFA